MVDIQDSRAFVRSTLLASLCTKRFAPLIAGCFDLIKMQHETPRFGDRSGKLKKERSETSRTYAVSSPPSASTDTRPPLEARKG